MSDVLAGTGRAVVKRIDEFREDIAPMMSQVYEMLPPNYAPSRFNGNLMAAVAKSPDVMEADRKSLYLALMRVARLRLDIGEGISLVVFNQKQKDGGYKKAVEAIVEYQGLKALAMREGIMRSASEKVVYVGETYRYEEGLDAVLQHQPLQGDPGRDQLAAYSIILLPFGRKTFNWMWIDAIEQIRAKSKSWSPSKGYQRPIPWYSKKTVFRDWINKQPKVGVLGEALKADDTNLEPVEVVPTGTEQGYPTADVGEPGQ